MCYLKRFTSLQDGVGSTALKPGTFPHFTVRFAVHMDDGNFELQLGIAVAGASYINSEDC